MNDKIFLKLKTLPMQPGVYIMKDVNNNIIYIGKSKNLKNRVSQYFNNSKKNLKTEIMVSNVFNFDYIITRNEIEAFIMENNLIKFNKPKYNILLKDDKRYPYIKINLKEIYPTIRMSRGIKLDGSKYFGPYFQDINIKDLMNIIYDVFHIRENKKNLEKLPTNHRPCINFQMKRCFAPCIKNIKQEDYALIVKNVIDFLNGNIKLVKDIYEEKLFKYIEEQKYEEAQKIKIILDSLKNLKRKQFAEFNDNIDKDAFAIIEEKNKRVLSVMFVRNSCLAFEKNYIINDASLDLEESLESFIKEFYLNSYSIPKKILVNIDLKEKENIKNFLDQILLTRSEIIFPKKGINKSIIDLTETNAKDFLNKAPDN